MYTTLIAMMMSAYTMTGSASNAAAVFNELPGELTEVILFYPNGNILQKGYMVDGQKTGLWTTYAITGEVTAKARYDAGAKEGKWRIYDADGNLEYKICYKNNKKVWAQQYDDAGNLTAFSHN